VEVKAKCTQCPMFWCPRCLSNRYGQQVAEVSHTGEMGAWNIGEVRVVNGSPSPASLRLSPRPLPPIPLQVSKLEVWACPRCEAKCNCSNCRKVRVKVMVKVMEEGG